MDVNTEDNVEVKERLTNTKPWFTGAKTFSSVKVNPAVPEQEPQTLTISVSDSVDSADKLV